MTGHAIDSHAAIDLKPLPVYCTACGNQIGKRWSRCVPGHADHKIGNPTRGELVYRASSSGGREMGAVRIQP